jgi:sterol desaturase/sphingolipid hydroxylase (fatty acid hydroxylase superfamily)
MPSFKYFTILNSALIGVGNITYYIMTHNPYLIPLWLFCLDIMFSKGLMYMNSIQIRETQPYKKVFYVSLFNSGTLLLSHAFANPSTHVLQELVFFIPYSFLFEVIFDFFHYSTHRLSHKIPFLYNAFHSYHHRHVYPTVLTTFEHKYGDLFLTNMLPVILTTLLLQPSQYFLSIWIGYKVLEEMYGHIGIPKHASSFPQCMWLPRLLGVELYSSQHALHHLKPSVNYSKRFILWDKVFGTAE